MNTHRSRTVGAGGGLAVLGFLALIGCSTVSRSSVANNNQPSNSNAAMEDSNNKPMDNDVDSRLVAANATFGFKLFAEVAKQDAGKNIFISPSSVGLALAMTYNGAVGETKQGMERALEIHGMSHLELNRAYAQLKVALESADPKVQLNIANSLWGRKEISFNPDFIQRNKQFYGADLTALDFNDPSAPATINSWVAEKTKGKIDKIVDRIDAQVILFLINAIYFKGTWAAEFDKAKTREDQFTTGGGNRRQSETSPDDASVGKVPLLRKQGLSSGQSTLRWRSPKHVHLPPVAREWPRCLSKEVDRRELGYLDEGVY